MTADVQASEIPDCSVCLLEGAGARLGFYNSPTRSDDPKTGGKWADLCGPHFDEHGLDTSVTERRVHYMHPNEVLSIARMWGGRDAEVMETDDGVWRFRASDGDLYEVHAPGRRWPAYEDDGRPCGDATSEGWHVRGINDAPDSHWEVRTDGVYRRYDGDVVVW